MPKPSRAKTSNMTIKPITKTITVQTVQGPKQIRAHVAGQLAFHPEWRPPEWPPCSDGERISITHVPTGLGVSDSRPEDARELVEKLSTLDWDFPGQVPPREITKATLEIIEQFFTARCARAVKMTDQEFNEAFFRALPVELRRQYAGATSEEEKNKLIEQIPEELMKAIGARDCWKRARAILNEPCSIGELFEKAAAAVPPPLADIQLRHFCLCSTSPQRLLIDWPNATWNHIQIERQDLAEHKRWGLLDELLELCRVVEPVMRDHPGRTLAAAFVLMDAEGQRAN